MNEKRKEENCRFLLSYPSVANGSRRETSGLGEGSVLLVTEQGETETKVTSAVQGFITRSQISSSLESIPTTSKLSRSFLARTGCFPSKTDRYSQVINIVALREQH